jgi:hypothetical protein
MRHARWYAGCWQRVPADSAGRRVLASARVVGARFARSGRPGRVGADTVRSTPRKRGWAGILTTWHDRAILRVRSRRVVVGPSRKSAWVTRQLAPDPAATCWFSRSGRNGARIVHQPDRREPGRGGESRKWRITRRDERGSSGSLFAPFARRCCFSGSWRFSRHDRADGRARTGAHLRPELLEGAIVRAILRPEPARWGKARTA